MSRGTQAEILAVLRDRIAQDEAPAREVREWVARELAGMRIAGPWECTNGRGGAIRANGEGNPLLRAWCRRHWGSQYSAASLSTGGGQPRTGERRWGGWAMSEPHLSLRSGEDFTRGEVPSVPAPESLAEAMAMVDEALAAGGRWLLMPGGRLPCPRCNGYGRMWPSLATCEDCLGDGGLFDGLTAPQSRGLVPTPVVVSVGENDAGG